GTAILYADRITDSMRYAIDETERRRNKQLAHNEAHGITPLSVTKRIKDIIEGMYEPDAARNQLKAAQAEAKYLAMSEKDVSREIRRLEKEMLHAAKNLEFERAASLRDQLKKLRETVLISPL
ncbi:MAG TPA: UvrB/UvrC motif-containing protein, partial [Gallionellaceae bacterium]|nr:UvrB/UvrC motif-containing protein [Gallionellaceae bacterium]